MRIAIGKCKNNQNIVNRWDTSLEDDMSLTLRPDGQTVQHNYYDQQQVEIGNLIQSAAVNLIKKQLENEMDH